MTYLRLMGRAIAGLIALCAVLPALGQGAAPKPAGPPPGVTVHPTIPPAAKKAFELWDRATHLQRARKNSEAISAYIQFLAVAPAAGISSTQMAAVYQNMSTLYRLQNDTANYEWALKQILTIQPANAGAAVQLALQYSAARNLDEAKAYAERALKSNPTPMYSAPAHFVLGSWYSIHGKMEQAEKEYGIAARQAPKNPQAQFNYAVVLGRLKRYPQALAAAKLAEAADPAMLPARLYIADLKVRLGDRPGAVMAYDQALKLSPKNVLAQFNRAVLLQQIGRSQDAISAYLRVLALDPNNLAAHLNLGQLYDAIGNNTAARDHFTIANRLGSKDPWAMDGLAMSETEDAIAATDPAKRVALSVQAEGHFKQVLAMRPDDAVALGGLGKLYERTNRFDDALALYQKQVKQHPDNPAGYYKLARVYIMERKPDDVIAIWKAYRAHKPSDPTSYQQTARILEAQGNYGAAITEWKALVSRDPRATNAMIALGRDEAMSKDIPGAIAQFNAVLAMPDPWKTVADPTAKRLAEANFEADRLDAMRGLARVDESQSKYADAITQWTAVKVRERELTANSTQPADPQPYQAIAADYEKLKNTDAAIKEYRNLTEIAPANTTAYDELSRLYMAQGKIDEAATALRDAAKNSKDPLTERLKIAEMYKANHRMDAALAEYQALANAGYQSAQLYSPMAEAYEQAGKNELALETLKKLADLDPSARYVQDQRALVLTRMKRYPEARTVYAAELDRDPDSYTTYADLAKVYQEEGKRADYLPWLQARLQKNPSQRVLMAAVLDEFMQAKNEAAGWSYLKTLMDQNKGKKAAEEAYAGLLEQHNKQPEALDVYRQIAAENPADVLAQEAYAEHLDRAGKRADATQLYRELVDRKTLPDTDRNGLRRTLAERLAQDGKTADAVTQYKEVLRTDPKDYVATAELAQVYGTSGQEAQAVPLYQILIAQSGFPAAVRAQLRDRLAAIFEKMGHKEDAIGQYREALKLVPDDRGAADALKRLGVTAAG